MIKNNLFIPVIIGTNREGRHSEAVANFLSSELKTNYPEIETKLIDPRDFHFPTDDYGQSIKGEFPEFVADMTAADGLIIVVPEYNHGYSGTLKTMLDMVYHSELKHKAVALAGVSTNPGGGMRAVENLLPVLREMGLAISWVNINFGRVGSLFDENGQILEPKFNDRASRFFDELIWLATAMRWGRNNLA